MKLVVCITGASGVIYGVKLLEELKKRKEIETFLVISNGAKKVIELETDHSINYIKSLADFYYDEDDFQAPIASSSFLIDGVVIVPTSMKTLSAIANGFGNNLITRVADIAIRMNKPLILVPRETPLSAIHLENMLKLAKLGVRILPACPGFYHKPKNIDDLINFIVGKILDILGLENRKFKRWGEENV